MSKPKPMRYPFRRNGPSRCYCTVCDWAGSTNALGQAAHLRGKQHVAADARRRENDAERDRPKADQTTGLQPGLNYLLR